MKLDDKDGTFTYHPKVGTNSTRIVETLKSDFMSRQQNHIEKQRKILERANQKIRTEFLMRDQQRYKRSNVDSYSPSNSKKSTLPTLPSSASSSPHSAASSPPHLSPLECLPRSSSDNYKRDDSPMSTDQISSISPDPNTDIVNGVLVDTTIIDNSILMNTVIDNTIAIDNLTRKAVNKPNMNYERMKVVKSTVDRAIKMKKIFTIQGPYPTVRRSLRRRGWVEKFSKMTNNNKKSPRSKLRKSIEEKRNENDNDDIDDLEYDLDTCTVPPWEEEDGKYGIMSRMVRNEDANFTWSLKRDPDDIKRLKPSHTVNHYGSAGSFTTKVGLCTNMRNVRWFLEADPDALFPRCYKLSQDDEKYSFIDDFHMTSCVSLLKWAQIKHDEKCNCCDRKSSPSEQNEHRTEQRKDKCRFPKVEGGHLVSSAGVIARRSHMVPRRKGVTLPNDTLQMALKECKRYLKHMNHEDIDFVYEDNETTESEWSTFLTNYYSAVHEQGVIHDVCRYIIDIDYILNEMKSRNAQFDIDGYKNVWIVKPGAKSRGRGITCYNKLEDMLKLVSSQIVKKDSKYIVQKYIESPLLIYHTKFDIRQWFLVTDWNPLTVWIYKDSYVRFCSQEYTLDNFDESIHLSNNSIQKFYANGTRSCHLPDDNMWHSDQFKDYLRIKGKHNTWEEVIYPNMKKALTCALMSAQDFVEYRKNAFALYGADFMLTEDYHPWLIEINCSPAMSFSTKTTTKLCSNVMEDTLKVVLDRRLDKNCSIGGFEMAFKNPQVLIPQYIGMSLQVDGVSIKKPRPPKEPFKKPEIKTDTSVENGEGDETETGDGDNKKVSENKKEKVAENKKEKVPEVQEGKEPIIDKNEEKEQSIGSSKDLSSIEVNGTDEEGTSTKKRCLTDAQIKYRDGISNNSSFKKPSEHSSLSSGGSLTSNLAEASRQSPNGDRLVPSISLREPMKTSQFISNMELAKINIINKHIARSMRQDNPYRDYPAKGDDLERSGNCIQNKLAKTLSKIRDSSYLSNVKYAESDMAGLLPLRRSITDMLGSDNLLLSTTRQRKFKRSSVDISELMASTFERMNPSSTIKPLSVNGIQQTINKPSHTKGIFPTMNCSPLRSVKIAERQSLFDRRKRATLKREETIAPLVNGYTLNGYPDVLTTRCQPLDPTNTVTTSTTSTRNRSTVPLYIDLYRQNSKLATLSRDICNEK